MAIIVKVGDNYNSPKIYDYMLESTTTSDIEAELAALTENAAPGSTASTPDLSKFYRLDSQGEWVEVM